jgi:hypothetical protein
MRLIAIMFLQLASCASLLGLYASVFPIDMANRPRWHWALITVIVIATIVSIWDDILRYIGTASKTFVDQNKIKKYMHNWINNGGRAAIFSRDLSWADEHDTKAVLMKKAVRRELTLFVQHSIPLAEELRKAGAKVVIYGDLNHTPRSRFTIVDYCRDGARVAIGAKVNGKHVIEEYTSGSHAFGVAEDFIRMLERCDEVKDVSPCS